MTQCVSIVLIVVALVPVAAQRAPSPALPESTAVSAKAPTIERNNGDRSDEIVTLSPFEVVSFTRGYFAANSLSGTRFNARLEDLAYPMTVVTKEQMRDFALLDLNDVFLYAASAEGTGTYTDFAVDRSGNVTDNVQVNPLAANRVRGIAPANLAFDNYSTMGRVPLDPLVVDTVEISRGPNANVFGLGNPSGTANVVPASADLRHEHTRIESRVDSLGGYRTSLDANRVILGGRLAVRLSGSRQHDSSPRKPSSLNTVRYNAMLKFRPLPDTTISAAIFYYRADGNRPNFTLPRDAVSTWVNSGHPGWDPVNQIIHVNGHTIGNGGVDTTTPITIDANLATFFTRPPPRGIVYVDRTGIAYWTAPTTNDPAATPFTPAANPQTVRLMQSLTDRAASQPLFSTSATVTGRALYDWSTINLASINGLTDQTTTSNVAVEQLWFHTPRQSLATQLGFFREDSKRWQNTPVVSSILYVDVNEKNLDGTPNPFFGRPYVGVSDAIVRSLPAKWDTWRAQVVYHLDLQREPNAWRWLGEHQLGVYDEYRYNVGRSYSYRDVLASNHPWTANGMPGFAADQARANVSGAAVVKTSFRYYVGDAAGANVSRAPSSFGYGTYPFVWGGYRLAGGVPVPGSAMFTREPATLSRWATTDQTGGLNNYKTIFKAYGAVLESSWFGGSLVTVFGRREDKQYSKSGALPRLLDGNSTHDFDADSHWADGDYSYYSGKTNTLSLVARPFRDLPFVRHAADRDGGVGHLVAELARGFALTYDRSDNFLPQRPGVDLFLKPLRNTNGVGRDYGFWLDVADGRFALRFNRYENSQKNARDSDANTVAQRVLRLDLDVSGESFQLYDRQDAWFRLLHPTWTDAQVRQAIADQSKIPVATYDALVANFRANTIATTNDVIAKGNELEINFNPTRHWTLAANATETWSINANISPALQRWIAERMPVWTTLVDPNTDATLGTGPSQGWVDANNPQHFWWLHNYGGNQTAQQNFSTFVDAPFRVLKAQEGKSKPNVRRYSFRVATRYDLAGRIDAGWLKRVRIGGAVRWEDRGAIGYFGRQAPPEVVLDLDPNRPIWDKPHTYVDAFVGYRTRLWADKVTANFQLNVRNVGENGRIQAVGAFPNGTPDVYRIVDPRLFVLSADFEF